jgi:uncharacterized protein (UPF0332 family)
MKVLVDESIGRFDEEKLLKRMAHDGFLAKAHHEINVAEALFEMGEFDSAANRLYYACYHAAISMLASVGIQSQTNRHDWVIGQFSREIIHRRKLMDSGFNNFLSMLQQERFKADYSTDSVSKGKLEPLLKKAHTFITNISDKVAS